MAEGRDRAEWDKLSTVVAFAANMMGSKRRVRPADFNPYPQPQRPSTRRGIRYRWNGAEVSKETFRTMMGKAKHARR